MRIQSMGGWQEHVSSGRRYLKTAGGGRKRPSVFNNELIFQLAAMGIESLIVGTCRFHRQMPCDHTLSGLVEALAAVCPLDAALADRIRQIERVDDVCALTPARRAVPGADTVREILAVGRDLAEWVDRTALIRETVSTADRV